jgi:hypothetical protein
MRQHRYLVMRRVRSVAHGLPPAGEDMVIGVAFLQWAGSPAPALRKAAAPLNLNYFGSVLSRLISAIWITAGARGNFACQEHEAFVVAYSAIVMRGPGAVAHGFGQFCAATRNPAIKDTRAITIPHGIAAVIDMASFISSSSFRIQLTSGDTSRQFSSSLSLMASSYRKFADIPLAFSDPSQPLLAMQAGGNRRSKAAL